MRLIQPNPGECVDRQTILHLKCKAGQAKGLHVGPWVEEINLIQNYLEKEWFPLAPKSIQNDFDTLYKELEKVNQELWELEDNIRAIMAMEAVDGHDQERVMEIAFAVPRLNDQRAELVKRMNALFGLQSQEKVYGASAK